MKRKFDLFLKDIIECVEKLKEYTKNVEYEQFKENNLSIDACVRNFEIIGEAIANLPEDLKARNVHVPWQEVKDFRNVILHKYWVVDTEVLWDIIQTKLDALKKQVQEVLKKETEKRN